MRWANGSKRGNRRQLAVSSTEDVSSLVHRTLLGDAWEHASVAVAVYAEDGRYVACNQAFSRLTGYSRPEIANLRVGIDLAGEGSKNHELFRHLVEGRKQVGQGRLRRKDGRELAVNVWAIETRAAGLPYFIVLYWEASRRPKRADIGR
jgi:PAS domain S-box-containing protein